MSDSKYTPKIGGTYAQVLSCLTDCLTGIHRHFPVYQILVHLLSSSLAANIEFKSTSVSVPASVLC